MDALLPVLPWLCVDVCDLGGEEEERDREGEEFSEVGFLSRTYLVEPHSTSFPSPRTLGPSFDNLVGWVVGRPAAKRGTEFSHSVRAFAF